MLHTTMFLGYTWIGLGTYFNLLVGIGALESFGTCGTRSCSCFRGIYNGDLWEDDDLHFCLNGSIASLGVL